MKDKQCIEFMYCKTGSYAYAKKHKSTNGLLNLHTLDIFGAIPRCSNEVLLDLFFWCFVGICWKHIIYFMAYTL